MIDRARTVADTEKSSIVSRAPKPGRAGDPANNETSIIVGAKEAVIPHGTYSTLMTSPATQAETTMTAIKDFILRAGLQVGDALPTESQLCADLGVSRSSVREAVRTLVALDIVEVRITLDNALAGPVTHAWKNRQDTELDTVVDQIEELASKGELFTEQDRRFHMRLLEPLDNHLFLHLTEAFWAIHTLTVPLLDNPTRPEDIISAAKAHRAMLQAARAGDVQAYRQATTRHYAPLLASLT